LERIKNLRETAFVKKPINQPKPAAKQKKIYEKNEEVSLAAEE
jgi:hypothetical protein